MNACRMLIALLLWLFAGAAQAHEIPNEVTLRAFVKPEGERLVLLIRVPLKAMREVEYPRRDGGHLDLARADRALRDAATLWIADNVELYEDDARLGYPKLIDARVSLDGDKSFAAYDTARAHLAGPRLPNDTSIFWEQGWLDAAFEYPVRSDRAQFSIRPNLDRLGQRVQIVLHFLPPDNAARAFELHGDAGLVRLDPRWQQAALRFVQTGFMHIIEGTDHLLFLLCLVIPYRRLRGLVVVVTSFTVAHSITLIASAFGAAPDALWFAPLIEVLIAVSIVYMAIENVIGARVERRWMITFAFGLAHGFGFSFALREQLQFAGSHLLTALLAFNVGVELGQLAALLLLVPLLQWICRRAATERIVIIVLSVLVGHTGWHWMMERGERLAQFPWPTLTYAGAASMLRWLLAAVILAALVWLAHIYLRNRRPRAAAMDASAAPPDSPH
jgi:hypothetical protein